MAVLISASTRDDPGKVTRGVGAKEGAHKPTARRKPLRLDIHIQEELVISTLGYIHTTNCTEYE